MVSLMFYLSYISNPSLFLLLFGTPQNQDSCGYFRWMDETDEKLEDGLVAELREHNAMLKAKLEAESQKTGA